MSKIKDKIPMFKTKEEAEVYAENARKEYKKKEEQKKNSSLKYQPRLPNSFDFPREFVDNYIMRVMTGAEAKVSVFFFRKIFGWHKDKNQDEISLSQVMEYTGLSDKTAVKAIRGLEEMGMVTVIRRKDEDGKWLTNIYKLNIRDNDGKTS